MRRLLLALAMTVGMASPAGAPPLNDTWGSGGGVNQNRNPSDHGGSGVFRNGSRRSWQDQLNDSRQRSQESYGRSWQDQRQHDQGHGNDG